MSIHGLAYIDILIYIFFAMIFIYGIGGTISLFLYKKFSLSNTVSCSFSMAAAFLGIIFSVSKLLFYSGSIIKYNLETNVIYNNNLSINFYIDNLSAFFILIISVLALIVSIYSLGYMKQFFYIRNVGYFGFLYNIFIVSMLLVVTSGQLFFFLIVWEVMSLVSYFLVVYENEKAEVQKAGRLYIIMTHMGTAFIVAAFVLIFKYTGSSELGNIDISKVPDIVKNIIFIFLVIGFGTKAGIIPLHIWLPSAHPAAPSNVSALMSGVMIKTAIYGIIRYIVIVMDAQHKWWGITILILGAVSTVLGVAYALMEHDIKKLLAYHSIENIGIILLGIGLAIISKFEGYYAIAALSMTAALLHTFNHSIFKGLLFLGAGSMHYSTKTKNIEKLGGLIKKMPYTALFFLIGALSISAMPPFNGFVSEWITYQAMMLNIVKSGSSIKILIIVAAGALALAGALAAYCFVKVYGISFLALPRSEGAEKAKEVPKTMLVSMGVLSAICLIIGIIPAFVIRLIDSVNYSVYNTIVLTNFKGVSSFLVYNFNLEKKVTISPVAVILLIMFIMSFLYLFILFTTKKTKIREYGTWDCGYSKLDSRMQYTATGFSKPIRIVLRAIYKPQRELEIDKSLSKYSFRSARYIVSTETIFEKYLYEPIIKTTINFARRMRLLIQTGSVHIYLIYFFVAIIFMFLYYGLV
jgi:hydrogenase-4 component B